MLFDFITIARAAEETAEHSGGIAALFGIKPELLLAQGINFAIIVLVLYKWVFKPLGKLMQERNQRIEKSLKDAHQSEERHKQTETEIASMMQQAHKEAAAVLHDIKAQGEKIMESSKHHAEEEKQRILAHAQKEATEMKAQALREAKSEIASLVVLATTKVLQKKLDPETDKKFIQQALDELS